MSEWENCLSAYLDKKSAVLSPGNPVIEVILKTPINFRGQFDTLKRDEKPVTEIMLGSLKNEVSPRKTSQERKLKTLKHSSKEIEKCEILNQLANIRWKYEMCKEFIRTQPHVRSLPEKCKVAGRLAFKQMEEQIRCLEAQIKEMGD